MDFGWLLFISAFPLICRLSIIFQPEMDCRTSSGLRRVYMTSLIKSLHVCWALKFTQTAAPTAKPVLAASPCGLLQVPVIAVCCDSPGKLRETGLEETGETAVRVCDPI